MQTALEKKLIAEVETLKRQVAMLLDRSGIKGEELAEAKFEDALDQFVSTGNKQFLDVAIKALREKETTNAVRT